ncbi:MAG: MXAN_6652 family MXYO-CTERM-anchored protein [Cystobacter sp.]
MRASFVRLGVISACLLSTPVLATSTGIIDHSGKTGMSCNMCHSGASGATVTITGPATLEPKATGQYTLIIKGGPAQVGGFNVAVDNSAAVLQAGTGSRKEAGELTHDKPGTFANGELRYAFSLVAPASGTIKIFGAGNSANGDYNSTKDSSATAQLSVTVGGGAGPTEPTPDEDEEKGGCSATGGAPMLLLGLAAATLGRRRRA